MISDHDLPAMHWLRESCRPGRWSEGQARRLVAVDLHLEKALIPCVENQLSVGAPQPTTMVGCFIAIDIAENRALLGLE